jgi:hypothetical protein
MPFDRTIFFDSVRASLFPKGLTQQQVDGMNFKLDVWEKMHSDADVRWLAYALGTCKLETASTMWPVEEIGKGKAQPYGRPDAVTGLAYYGRGDVQLTWSTNYQKMTKLLGLAGADDLYWHPERALDPAISANVMYLGMMQGTFRPPHKLPTYFSRTRDEPIPARNIINGDTNTVPKWSNGASIGSIVASYHRSFLAALQAAKVDAPPAPPTPTPPAPAVVHITLKIEVTPAGAATVTVLT